MTRLFCFIFGHSWFVALGYSTGKRMRLCTECRKQEEF